jgi:hypothetical protein
MTLMENNNNIVNKLSKYVNLTILAKLQGITISKYFLEPSIFHMQQQEINGSFLPNSLYPKCLSWQLLYRDFGARKAIKIFFMFSSKELKI